MYGLQSDIACSQTASLIIAVGILPSAIRSLVSVAASTATRIGPLCQWLEWRGPIQFESV